VEFHRTVRQRTHPLGERALRSAVGVRHGCFAGLEAHDGDELVVVGEPEGLPEPAGRLTDGVAPEQDEVAYLVATGAPGLDYLDEHHAPDVSELRDEDCPGRPARNPPVRRPEGNRVGLSSRWPSPTQAGGADLGDTLTLC
jgi:hypothetical protein